MEQKNLYDQMLDILYDQNFDLNDFKNKLNEFGVNWPSIKQDYNKIFADEYLIDNPGGGDCAFWSSLIAFGYVLDENKMLKLRQDVAERKNNESVKSKGTWYSNTEVLACLSNQENNRPYGCINRSRLSDESLKTISEKQLKANEYFMEPNGYFKYLDIYSVPFKDFVNGCPFTVLINNNHYKTLKRDVEIRKKIALDFYDLRFKNAIHQQINLKGLGLFRGIEEEERYITLCFMDHVVSLFVPFQNEYEQDDEDDSEWDKLYKKIKKRVKKLLDETTSSDEEKRIKTLRLIFFLYIQYRKKVIEPLNFEIKTEDFLMELIDDFAFMELIADVKNLFAYENKKFKLSKQKQLDIVNKINNLNAEQKKQACEHLVYCKFNPKPEIEVIEVLMKNGVFNFDLFAKYADNPDLQLIGLENMSDYTKELWQDMYVENLAMFSCFDERVLKKLSELGFDVDTKSLGPELKNKYNKANFDNLYSQALNNDLIIDDINKNYVSGDCGPYAAKRSLEIYLEEHPTPENQKKLADLKSKSISDLRKEVGEHWLKRNTLNKNDNDYKEIITDRCSCEARYFSSYLKLKYDIDIIDCTLPNFRPDAKYPYPNQTPFTKGYCGDLSNVLYRDLFFYFIDGYPITFYTGGHYVFLDSNKEKRKDLFKKIFRFSVYSGGYNLYVIENKGHIWLNEDTIFGVLDELFKCNLDQEAKISPKIKTYLDQIPLKYRARKIFELIKFMYDKFIDLIVEPENRNITAEEFLTKVLEDFKIKNLDKDENIKAKLEADKNKEAKNNMQEHDEDETKKLIDELIDWDDDKDCFKTSVQRQLEIISKLDDKQKKYLKDYLVDDGKLELLMFNFKVIEQLVKEKIFPYQFFYAFKTRPDLQIFMLENINDDQNLKDELLSVDYRSNIFGHHESVLKKFEEVTGIDLDYNISYENLEKIFNQDTYRASHKDIYDNEVQVIDVRGDGNCIFYSLIQAYENIALKEEDYNEELKQKVIKLREAAAEDYKLNYEDYGDKVFNHEVYRGLKEYKSAFRPEYAATYFTKKYKKSCFVFELDSENYSNFVASPFLMYIKAPEKNNNNKSYIGTSCIKDMLIDFFNGAPSIVLNEIHCKTVNFNMNRDQLKEFITKFIRLEFDCGVCRDLLDYGDNKNPTSLDSILNKSGLDFLFGIDENPEQELKNGLVSYFDAVPEKYRARKIFEFRKFMIEKFIELVIEPENINITAEEFLSRALEAFKIENLAKEQDFDVELRKKFEKPNREIKNPDPKNNENQNQTHTQTEKPDIQKKETNNNNNNELPKSKDEKSEKIKQKPDQNQTQNIETAIIKNDELDLNLVRNSMLFVSVVLGKKESYEKILAMKDDDLKSFYEKNKTRIDSVATEIRNNARIKEFLKQETKTGDMDIIKLNASQIEKLNNNLNDKHSKEWIAGLSGGAVVSVSLGVAAACTLFPALGFSSLAIALPTLVLTCYKFTQNKIINSKKSGIIGQLKLTQNRDFLGTLDIKSDEQIK